ncbi:MAG TPA: polysaccharide biosynthesis protein, partial [Sulfitobacter sp.]|nr:polysaccharide biosynthesis protein [Sulfitobacter sp.]
MRDRGWTVIRSFGFLLSGNACAAAILLLRTVVVSRLISLEDFGIGTSLVLALAMIEMLTALGFQQQIVNAPKGDDADFHSALHGVALIRGMIGTAALFLLAPLLAHAFGVEQLTWAFQLISVVPLLQG